jgi:hypothetical protein
MIRYIRTWLAHRRLQRLVDASKRAPATREFVRRREAALKHTRREMAR